MDPLILKYILGILATILTFWGYLYYIVDILKNQTRPHAFSWFISVLVNSIMFALQWSEGAGAGSFPTLMVAVVSCFVFYLSLRNGSRDIIKIDGVFLFLSISAIPVWYFTKEPLWSALLLVFIGVSGFLPTLRKTWVDPYSENLDFYVISFFRHLLSILALQTYTLTTYLQPGVWVFMNLIFLIIMLAKRRNYKSEA